METDDKMISSPDTSSLKHGREKTTPGEDTLGSNHECDDELLDCWFCGRRSSALMPVTKHPGLGLLCALCVTKMKAFQMY